MQNHVSNELAVPRFPISTSRFRYATTAVIVHFLMINDSLLAFQYVVQLCFDELAHVEVWYLGNLLGR